MEPRYQISSAGIALIKRFEGLRRVAARLDDGRWTIGYGHTRTARAGAEVTERDAESLLLYDLIPVSYAVNEWVYADLNQNQFDSLVSFAFSIGTESFRRCLTLRRLNEGRVVEAALAMEMWRRADFEGERMVIDALVRRRACEKTLFLKPLGAWPAAPTPVLPPKLDYEAAASLPTQTPTVLNARLDGDRAKVDRAAPVALPTQPRADPSATEPSERAVAESLEEADSHEPELDLGQSPDDMANTEGAELAANDVGTQQTAQSVNNAGDDAVTAAAPESLVFSVSRRERGPVPWFVLGLFGIGLFTIAVRYYLHRSVHGVLPFAGGALGWTLGIVGVACFATAAYFLFMRLAGRVPARRY